MQLSMHFKIALAPILHGIYSIPLTWQKENKGAYRGVKCFKYRSMRRAPLDTYWPPLSSHPLKNPGWTADYKIIPDHAALKMACIFATCTAWKSRFNQTLSYLLGSKWTTKQCYPFCNCFIVILPPHRLSTNQFTTFTFAPQERPSGELTGRATSWWRDDLFSLILINRGLVITNVCICMLVSPTKTIRPSAIRNCQSCFTSEEYLEGEPTKSETFRWRNDQ